VCCCVTPDKVLKVKSHCLVKMRVDYLGQLEMEIKLKLKSLFGKDERRLFWTVEEQKPLGQMIDSRGQQISRTIVTFRVD